MLMLAEDGGDDCEEANEVMNCCKHLVNEMETLKSEIDKVPFNPDTAILARQVRQAQSPFGASSDICITHSPTPGDC